MTLTTERRLAAITTYSERVAQVARIELTGPVEHCPGWTVADLVWHLSEVQWFWAVIAGERLTGPPDAARRPPRPDDEGLVAVFEAGAARLVEVLGRADQAAACWTWSSQQDVAFVTRHQGQEAAVHGWDAVHAVHAGRGDELVIERDVAADAVDEFLMFSVPTEPDPDAPAAPGLGGDLTLLASDARSAWTVRDGTSPGTLRVHRHQPADLGTLGAGVEGTASDLLLWLYGRVELETGELADRAARFRALCRTD